MRTAGFQKYVGTLGGIGASGVGSSSSYAPKELNKEIMPEKVGLCFCIYISIVRVCWQWHPHFIVLYSGLKEMLHLF